MASEINYGWVCPKCGCPNAPTNKTCVACFSHEEQWPKVPMPFMPTTPPAEKWEMPTTCAKCGMRIDGALGYVCPTPGCPCGLGGITSFNPLNAKDNT